MSINLNNIKNDNIPNDFYTFIEISAESPPVKYEFDKENNILLVDRFVATPMFYPANYGFVPNTMSDDGDPIDVLVITPYPLLSGCLIKVRPIGVLNMSDESGKDFKILAVPVGKLCSSYEKVVDITDIEVSLLKKIEHFFEHYKDLEDGKWVKLDGWDNAKKAKEILVASVNFFNKK